MSHTLGHWCGEFGCGRRRIEKNLNKIRARSRYKLVKIESEMLSLREGMVKDGGENWSGYERALRMKMSKTSALL